MAPARRMRGAILVELLHFSQEEKYEFPQYKI